jgi:single-stranded DNA-binding protein
MASCYGWGKTADIIENMLSKERDRNRRQVTHRSYDKNGEKRYVTEIANEVLL